MTTTMTIFVSCMRWRKFAGHDCDRNDDCDGNADKADASEEDDDGTNGGN